MDPRRGKNVTKAQLMMLATFMEENPDLAQNKLGPGFTKTDRKRKWHELAENLNCIGGAQKPATKWSKCWSDKKQDVRAKASRIFNSHGTGEGPPSTEELSVLEEKVLAVAGYTSVRGDTNIIEGGTPSSQPQDDDFFQDSNGVVELIFEEAETTNVTSPICLIGEPSSLTGETPASEMTPSSSKSNRSQTAHKKKRKSRQPIAADTSAAMLRLMERQTAAYERMAEIQEQQLSESKKLNETLTATFQALLEVVAANRSKDQ